MSDSVGVCPLCESTGPAASRCDGAICRKKELHFIPQSYFEAIRKHSLQTRDPYLGVLIGNYLIVDIIGRGGFGKVYLALAQPLLMPAALKLMINRAESGAAERMTAKFRDEALSLSKLNHPNIVRLLHYGSHNAAPYMVMEYVPGGQTLEREVVSRMKADTPFAGGEIRHIVRQTLNALASAHEMGIVHRDIKPENLMLQRITGDPHFVRILDFGLAKFVEDGTSTSVAMGSPYYMAPEQLTMKNIGPWTDLYAVGVICFQLLTGRQPFGGFSVQQIMAQKLHPQYDPLSTVEDLELPAPVQEFLSTAINRSVEQRFNDASSFGQGLGNALDALEAVGGPRRLSDPQAIAPDSLDLDSMALTADATPELGPVNTGDVTPERTPRQLPDGRSRSPEPVLGDADTMIAPSSGEHRPLKPQRAPVIPARLPGWRKWAAALLMLALLAGGFLVGRSLRKKSVTIADELVGVYVLESRKVPRIPVEANRRLPNKPGRVRIGAIVGADKRKAESSKAWNACRRFVSARSLKRPILQRSIADPDGALKSCRKSCEKQSGRACFVLGRMARLGLGQAADDKIALARFRQACLLKTGAGCLHAGFLLRKGGSTTVEPRIEESVGLIRRGCVLEHGKACTELGKMLLRGLGVPEDKVQGLANYKKACALGDSWGCTKLGLEYQRGKSVTADSGAALKLFLRGCELKNGRSCSYAAHGYLAGGPIPKDETKAFELFSRSCELNWGYGCRKAGEFLRSGRGTKRDCTVANTMFRKACHLRIKKACRETCAER